MVCFAIHELGRMSAGILGRHGFFSYKVMAWCNRFMDIALLLIALLHGSSGMDHDMHYLALMCMYTILTLFLVYGHGFH